MKIHHKADSLPAVSTPLPLPATIIVWADAKLDGNAVVVSSPDVPKPVRVRYAWTTYPPSMRLFNREGFPAFPFQGRAR